MCMENTQSIRNHRVWLRHEPKVKIQCAGGHVVFAGEFPSPLAAGRHSSAGGSGLAEQAQVDVLGRSRPLVQWADNLEREDGA